MKLNDIISGNFDAAEWEAKGYQLPKFDIKALREKTAKEPTWVHFGGGNIFRAFPAAILNDALNTGKYDRGVIVAETFDFEVIDKAYAPYNNLSLLVSLQSTGTIEKKVIASVTEALKADPQFPDWQRLVDIFRNPSLQMISFTITEKGYTYNEADLARGLKPVFAMGKVCALLLERFKRRSAASHHSVDGQLLPQWRQGQGWRLRLCRALGSRWPCARSFPRLSEGRIQDHLPLVDD